MSRQEQAKRNAELRLRAQQCRLQVHERAQQNRGKGTKSSYDPAQEEFKRWCQRMKFDSFSAETVSAEKLLMFLMDEVIDRPSRIGSHGGTVAQCSACRSF